MKTILSSGILGFCCFGFLACGGDDAEPDASADSAAVDMADSTDGAFDGDGADDGDGDGADDGDDGDDGDAAPAEEQPVLATPGATAIPGAEAAVDPSLVAAPALAWRSCGTFQDRDLECAEVMVPLDYDEPDGEVLPIAMRRIAANPLEPYKGALLINPGGPGGAGIDFVLSVMPFGMFDAIAPGYDIIGFDPRGVGDSGERGCGVGSEGIAFPVGAASTAELESYVASLAARGAQCEREWGPLFRELGSTNVVRDMEEIRKALKESKLNFYGASYGTRLGSLYAHMFPATTGRIVIDATVHPRSSWVEGVRDTFYQLVAMHEQVFVDCEAGVLTCPPEPRVLFEQLLDTAREGGFEQALTGFWKSALESEGGPQALADVLSAQASDPGGGWLVELLSRGGGAVDGGAGEVALMSVNCTDDVYEPPSIAEAEALFTEFNAVNPLYADDAWDALLCTGWPVTPDPVPLPTALEVDEPVLVIGGLNDWRTPYSQSAAMTEALGKAVLLTSDHQGHAAVRPRNGCVNYFVRAFLTSGSLPATGSLCE